MLMCVVALGYDVLCCVVLCCAVLCCAVLRNVLVLCCIDAEHGLSSLVVRIQLNMSVANSKPPKKAAASKAKPKAKAKAK